VYLGYVIGGGEKKIDPAKMEAIMKWLVPRNFTEVRSFVGETQYLQNFIASFIAVDAPLYTIKSNGNSLWWGNSQKRAFNELKIKIIQAPMLMLPNFPKPFEVETNSSGCAMGVVLM
jgi:hypothetical protein